MLSSLELEAHDVIVPNYARALLLLLSTDLIAAYKKGTNKSKSRLIIIVTPRSLLVQACRLAGVDRRENTGQEGEPHRRAHRSLGDYASLVQGVATFTASSVRSR